MYDVRGTSHDGMMKPTYTSWGGEEEYEWSLEWGADNNGANAWQQVWWCYDEDGWFEPRRACTLLKTSLISDPPV